MPHPEAPVESRLSPAHDPLAAFLPWLELREVLRKTLQVGDVSSALGWPRTLDPELNRRWFAGPQVVCTLAHASDLDQPLAYVALPVDQAVALVDVCLGGPGRPGVATQAGIPSDAECGVLAYLAARCVRICAPALRLRDLAARRVAELPSWPEGAWIWPVRVKLAGLLELELALIVGASSPPSHTPITAQLSIDDDLDAASLANLREGDLLLCETWPGQFTHAGLSGALELVAPALQASLRVALEAGKVRVLRDASATRRPARARLILGEVSASLAELALLASGGCGLPVAPLQAARIELDGATVASGTLVRYGGALALEVCALPSIR